ncbi:MAG: diguanylate cyclase [Pseudomonadota bacterium]
MQKNLAAAVANDRPTAQPRQTPLPVWAQPARQSVDPVLRAASITGERLLAALRLSAWAMIALAPLSNIAATGPDVTESTMGLAVLSAIALVMSAIGWLAIRRRWISDQLGFVTGIADVTLLTCAFAMFIAFGRADSVLSNQTAWALYPLIIVTACLRLNMVLVIVMGALAMVQYGVLVYWQSTLAVPVATIGEAVHWARLLIMLLTTAVTMAAVSAMYSLVRKPGYDPLTGLATRESFRDRLASEIERARRYNESLSLAIFDIDNLEAINRREGFAAGDAALQTFAKVVRRNKRAQDFAARWSESEIAILLPHTNEAGAQTMGTRLVQQIRLTEIKSVPSYGQVKARFGVSTLGSDGESNTGLFSVAQWRADLAKTEPALVATI